MAVLLYFQILIITTVCCSIGYGQTIEYFDRDILLLQPDEELSSFTNPHSNYAVSLRRTSGEHVTKTPEMSSQLTIRADFSIDYLYVYNEAGFDVFIRNVDSVASINVAKGQYGFIAGYFPDTHEQLFLFRDSLQVAESLEVTISEKEAIRQCQFALLRESGVPLHVSTLIFYFRNLNSGVALRVENYNISTTPFSLRFNRLPDNFRNEWAAKGKQGFNGGSLYLVGGEVKQPDVDSLVTNDPASFASNEFRYHFPDSVENKGNIQIFTSYPDIHTWGGGDVFYRSPVHLKVFQDTTARFPLRVSTFSQTIFAANLHFGTYLVSPLIRIGDSKTVGFFPTDTLSHPFTLSEQGNITDLGIGPTYWSGNFENESDTIKIRSPYGRWVQLFLAQNNEVLLQYAVDYKLYQDGELLKAGKFPPYNVVPLMNVGFNPDSLTIPVQQNSYELVVNNRHLQLAGKSGTSQVTANFNLFLPDKNPPCITRFQILKDGRLTNTIQPDDLVTFRFELKDEDNISEMRFYYTSLEDTTWSEIPVQADESHWMGNLSIQQKGYYSLRLHASDMSGNSIDCLIAPGLLVDTPTGISAGMPQNSNSVDKILLHPSYPNPTNSEIIIRYTVNAQTEQKISIAIYNSLGQQVWKAQKASGIPGYHEIKWNGINSGGNIVSSGIYLLKFEGSEIAQIQKIFLVR